MSRLYGRLARLHAAAGVMAMMAGLAAVPQQAAGATAPIRCNGVCSASWDALLFTCYVNSYCIDCTCDYDRHYEPGTTRLIGCSGGACTPPA